jgi:fatty-acyl-CoA synthase
MTQAFNVTPRATLGAVLDQMARTGGQRPAVIHFNETISYRELQQRAREAARALLALGVKRGDRVGVLLGNQPEWMVMCFAAAYVGATFVPLNTWYKKTELAWTLRHCELSVVVAAGRFLTQNYAAILQDLLPGLAQAQPGNLQSIEYPHLRVLAVLGEPLAGTLSWRELLAQARHATDADVESAAAAVRETDPAFVLYTSGSLAAPKGVVLNHGGVIRNAFSMGERRSIHSEDRVWLGSPLFYGLGATNAMPVALTHGAALVLQGSFDAGIAIKTVADTQATVYYGTGNMTRAILDHHDYAQAKVGSLKKGNAGTSTEYKRMTLVEMGVSLACPAYGLTESYGNATVGMADDPLEVKLHTSGRPLPGFELLVVDPATSAPLPAGQVGLVLLRGYTTPGYLGSPEETARALRPDGFFDTGDLGLLDADGRFVFHARLKEVIKSGGINVSPLEVEQLLVQHPDVRDAYVVGVADPARGELIVAFVDVRRAVDARALREFVKERAASFKVPHHVLFRTEQQLPRLQSGKVSKYRLVEDAQRELGL